MRRIVALGVLFGALLALGGCNTVKPWERETLARRDMLWDPDSLIAVRNSHVWFAKEGTLLGGTGAGGGCGCN